MPVIIDYGLGNLRSVQKAFEKIKIKAIISGSKEVISNAGKLILPGVGHFEKGMNNLKEAGLVDILNEKVLVKKTPILGICLGMQLMTKSSEEGYCTGLGWINAVTERFELNSEDKYFKIPHIGWDHLEIRNKSNLFRDVDLDNQFYFVHSYKVKCQNAVDELTRTYYGVNFTSSFEKDNILGVQFHPEKSYNSGLQILKNFVENY